MADDFESVILVKAEVYVYKIPPRATNRGYRATDWNLDLPDWTGRLRVVTKNGEVIIKLEDKNTGALFAACPVDTYPGPAIEAVNDSSRYFVIRIQDETSGRAAFIGLGFGDRSDSFDFNVALQDHMRFKKKEQDIENEEKEDGGKGKPSLDLSFKEGETIKINMKIAKKDGDGSKVKKTGTSSGFLPPPPSGGGMKIAPPPNDTTMNAKITPTGSPSHLPSQPDKSAAAAAAASNSSWVQF